MNRLLDVATSFVVTVARLGAGMEVGPIGRRPEKPLELYEFEGCPFCRKVREALSVLDLDAVVYPCPKNGPRFRTDVEGRGGKALFPWFVDRNTGVGHRVHQKRWRCFLSYVFLVRKQRNQFR